MAIPPTSRLATSPAEADATKTKIKTQPSRLERTSPATKRRAKSGSSPLVHCMLQPTTHNKKNWKALTIMGTVTKLLVTVSAVRYTAGGQVQTFHGSVTREKPCNEQCMPQSSHKHNNTDMCIITGLHNAYCKPPAGGTLSTHLKHTRAMQAAGVSEKIAGALTTARTTVCSCMQIPHIHIT